MGASTASVREAVAVLCVSIVAAAAGLLANIDWQWGWCGTEVGGIRNNRVQGTCDCCGCPTVQRWLAAGVPISLGLKVLKLEWTGKYCRTVCEE